MSDVELTKLSGLIDLLESGDSIMADKGFVLNKVLDGTGISINTPPFLMSQGQFTKQEVEQTQIIAKLRIYAGLRSIICLIVLSLCPPVVDRRKSAYVV